MKKVRVRYPPSPTGYCHVGTARMALLNYLFAKKHGGAIIFRSEDTDKERSTKEFEEDILESIKWLGLPWDEFYRQSERLEQHKVAIQKLIAEDKAYVSEEESKKEPGKMMSPVRLRNPGKQITFTDIIRGEITFDTTELGDFVIARAIDDPLYHLAVVIDDAEMGITHVIRGEDHISNTPRQILIQEALEYERPEYAHFPLNLAADRSKLSKRKGDVAVRSYRTQGFLAAALDNYLAVVGWTPPSGKEILSLEEMIQEFELSAMHPSGGVFDVEKLRWFNRQYLEKMDENEFADYALPVLRSALAEREIEWQENISRAMLPIIRERISVATDIAEMAAAGEFDLFFVDPQPEPSRIPEKKSNAVEATKHLEHVRMTFNDMSEWTTQALKDAVWDYATKEGRGAVLWPLRYALSGREQSPDPFTIASIIGKESTLRRVSKTIAVLETI